MWTLIWIVVAVYATVGLIFLLRSGSRGFGADMHFALLWPVYLWMYWRHGIRRHDQKN